MKGVLNGDRKMKLAAAATAAAVAATASSNFRMARRTDDARRCGFLAGGCNHSLDWRRANRKKTDHADRAVTERDERMRVR